MNFDSVLEGRRSVRAYDENKKVTSEQVEQLVQSAIYAPSWKILKPQDIIAQCRSRELKR